MAKAHAVESRLVNKQLAKHRARHDRSHKVMLRDLREIEGEAKDRDARDLSRSKVPALDRLRGSHGRGCAKERLGRSHGGHDRYLARAHTDDAAAIACGFN
jgi:hypothetical protein